MARTFDGVDDEIRCSVGALSGITGYGSIALIARRVGSAEPVPIAAYQANTARTGFHFDGGDMYYVTSTGFVTAGFTVDANIWNVAVVTKDTGTVSARFHQYGYDDNLWEHSNSSGTVADGATSASTIRLGGPGAGNPYDGDIAVAAWWKGVVLTDAQIETLPYSLQAWLALAPTAMWVLDQSATTQAVIDLTGGGANQSAITGTAVATSSAPIGYGFEVAVPHGQAAGGTTVNGTGAGAYTFTGAAAGVPRTPGTAAGAFTFTGSASGSTQTTVTGTGSGAFSFTGTAAGTPETFGTAQASLSFAGAAAGVPDVQGAAGVSVTFTGAASGNPDVQGQAAAAFTFTGAASGEVEGAVSGTGLGAYTFTGTAAGVPDVHGTAAAALAFAGAATGVRVRLGQATATLTFDGSALGAPVLFGQAAAAFTFTGTAAGIIPGQFPDPNPFHLIYRERATLTYHERSTFTYREAQ